MSDFFIDDFYEEMSKVNLNAFGILDSNAHIHTLGTDSKIIGRVFEMFTQPVLEHIARKHNLLLKTPDKQTVYPDFILMRDESSTEKIAIDVKTTYIENGKTAISFALGSFASYMRNNTKNIAYQYTDYARHYVIGFVYKRNGQAQESKVYDFSQRHEIVFPYRDVQFFIQEKYKIAGDKPGSGNTENIGSISSANLDDFKLGHGPFSTLGADAFEIYWKYYPQYRSLDKYYTCLLEFLEWLPCHIKEVELLHPFNREELLTKVNEYRKNRVL